MACFHKCSYPAKHVRHKNLPVNSVYTEKTGEYFKQEYFD